MKQRHGDRERQQEREGHAHISSRDGKKSCNCEDRAGGREETISKVKRQPSEWEKIIASEATDKQLISKIFGNACKN